jgi:LysM repeat protein
MTKLPSYETLPEHAQRTLYAIAHRVGVTVADIKRITPTHVHTHNHRKIPHNLTIVKETIEL